MKSYLEITQTCEILDYIESMYMRTEVWMDETHMYKCVWFNSNNWNCPNTIYRESL